MSKVFPDDKKSSGLLSPSMACAKWCRIKSPICNRSILPLSDCQVYTQQNNTHHSQKKWLETQVYFFFKEKKIPTKT